MDKRNPLPQTQDCNQLKLHTHLISVFRWKSVQQPAMVVVTSVFDIFGHFYSHFIVVSMTSMTALTTICLQKYHLGVNVLIFSLSEAYNHWSIHLQILMERVHRLEDEASGVVVEEVVVVEAAAETMAEGKYTLLWWVELHTKMWWFNAFLFSGHQNPRDEWAVLCT